MATSLLSYEGEHITELSAYAANSGKCWVIQPLQQPAMGKAGPSVGDEFFALYHIPAAMPMHSAESQGRDRGVDSAIENVPRVEQLEEPGMAVVKGSGPMPIADARTGVFQQIGTRKD